MGAVISSLFDAVKGLRAALALLSALSADFNAALKRAAKSPGLPNPEPTRSYWQEDPPFPELVNIRSPALPVRADVAIIGSGIAGAAVARSLLHERRRQKSEPGKVVVFEARELCNGATARNGGHIKPTPYEVFPRFRKAMTPERAAALTRFQLRHISALTELCDAEGIEVAEAREVETADLFLDTEAFEKAVAGVQSMKEWLPGVEVGIWKGVDARKKFGVNDSVVGAMSYRAGALWPYRFVVSIWKRLLEEFPEVLSIETTTPVESISTGNNDPEFPYIVHTPRGNVQVRHVVHATNAWASHLVPGVRSKITGVRAHMSAQRPGEHFPNSRGNRSWGVIYGEGFDYVTQRPSSPDGSQGNLMLGGGFTRSMKQGIDQVGLYDDGAPIDGLTVSHICGIFPAIFSPNWGPNSAINQVWPGILGITGDLCPFVGRLDGSLTRRRISSKKPEKDGESAPGEWIAAGFAGEGMVWAWLSGMALGIMMAGSEGTSLPEVPGRPGGLLSEWFPEELLVTRARLRSADISNLAS